VVATVEELVGNITGLTSFPDVAIRISELVADENSGAAEIGALIEPDPALSAALLRIANSAAYSVGGTVSTVERAVTVVGLREVKDLAFGICVSETFNGIPNDLITVEDFWKHSLFCAAVSQNLGRKARVCYGESLFTAGLLHDIGQLVMFSQSPESSTEALALSLEENDGLSPYLSEFEVFGFDHALVGATLMRQWHLPEHLTDCIASHHEPFELSTNGAIGEPSDAACVVHIANSVAVLAELDSHCLSDAAQIDERAFAQLGLKPDVIPEIVSESQDSVGELLRIILH